jgi:hypothetical protein
MISDLTKPGKFSGLEGLQDLQEVLVLLVGQPCLKVDLSYGNELLLHLSHPVPYDHPQMADETKGAWMLCTRASGWNLRLNDLPTLIECGLPGSSDSSPLWWKGTWQTDQRQPIKGAEIEQMAKQMAEKTVTAATPFVETPGRGIGVIIKFTDDSSLTVVPSSEPREEEDDFPDWELFTPHHTYLRVGPGLEWRCLRSNEPEDSPRT